MSNSNLQKGVILNGQDSLAVFKENGLVYRVSDINSFTPITFYALLAGLTYECEIGTLLDKSYKVVDTAADFKGDDDLLVVNEQNASSISSFGAYISIIRQGKRVFNRYLQPYFFSNFSSLIVLQPNDLVRITPNSDMNSLTFYCVPIYLENPIAIPSLPNNDSNNTGNENPSPEPDSI